MSHARLYQSVIFSVLVVLGAFIGCTTQPPDGGGGDGATCQEDGDGCETDADCCDGLTCQEWTCEPAGDVPDGGGDTDGDGGGEVPDGGIIADHNAAVAFDDIATSAIDTAKANYNIFYGHTSHGSQIVTGMGMIHADDSRFSFNAGSGSLSMQENEGADLGGVSDLPGTPWADTTRDILDGPGNENNMVMWSWCGGVSDNTEQGINTYLNTMDQLESDYPDVVFVYMTGHLDGTGTSGNLHIRNEQIRDYCRANDKVLYDFADIESYDPDDNHYPDGSDWCEWCEAWCASHTCPDHDCVDDEGCQHAVCFNCYQKGRAFWWMMAQIAGLGDSSSDTEPPDDGGDTPDDGEVSAEGGEPTERLEPAHLTYEGAFRLPDDFVWGALGLSFYSSGDGGAGSLLVTGFEALSDPAHPGACWDPSWDCYANYGEIAIPTPAEESNWEDLPTAALLTPMTPFDGGLASTVHNEYVFVSDLAYVPRQGSQTGDKIYGSLNLWYAEGAFGETTFPTIWFADMDGTNAQGMFHVGPEETPYHGRKMGAYLFSAPQWYADDYLGGRTLVTGRARGTPAGSFDEVTTSGGSQGPTLFAFHPWESDTATGDLDALPMLYYRVKFPGCAGPNVGDPDVCDYNSYTMCDEWNGGAFVDNGLQRAIMLLGYKGLGENCYDEPPVECNDPCSDSHGYHCQPYERQVIFYDVHELGHSALGNQDPWVVEPYTVWRPDRFYLTGDTCWNVGGIAFDASTGRLFMTERGLGEGEMNAAVVHVWSL